MSNKMINSKPIKMWIDGKIFPIQNLNKTGKSSKRNRKQNSSEPPEIQPLSNAYLQLLDITEDNGKFITSIKVPKVYYTKIQNLPELDIKKLSEITKTKITLPKLGQHEGGITLHSDNRDDLSRAVNHIHSAIGEIRERNIGLQFTCIPCLNSNIRASFENLKREILKMEEDIEGLHESIFICPLKLHVTIDVYVLLDDKEKAEAIQTLKDYKSTLKELLQKTGPLKLDIGTLGCMNSNVKKVDVLYANVKILNETDECSLQKIVNNIAEHFYHRGLAKKYQEHIKLHMTVINTKYRKNFETPKRKRTRQSLDATKIMEKFKDYMFGHCEFESVHLSHISVKGKDGFYKPLAVINLNENKD